MLRKILWIAMLLFLPYGMANAAHKWVVYYAQGLPKHAQAYEVTETWEDMADAIEERWYQGYDVISLVQGYTRWAAIFEKHTGMRAQSYSVRGDREVFFGVMRKKLQAGEALVDLAYGDGVFVGIFAKGRPVPKVVIEEYYKPMMKRIKGLWGKGYAVDFIRYYEGHWIVTMVKRKEIPMQTVEKTRTWGQFSRIIRQRWSEGYYLTDLHLGFGDWIGVFTKTNAYKAQAYDLANGWGTLGNAIVKRWREGWRIVGMAEGW